MDRRTSLTLAGCPAEPNRAAVLARRALWPVLLLAACAEPPAPSPLRRALERDGGWRDPVTLAVLNAPGSFGNLARFRDDPAAAARGVASLEFLTDAFLNDQRWTPRSNPVLSVQLRQAQAWVRQTLGIAPGAPSASVVAALREAADLVEANDIAAARRILVPPVFTDGGGETLRRLGDLENNRTVAAAAQSVAQAGMQPGMQTGMQPGMQPGMGRPSGGRR